MVSISHFRLGGRYFAASKSGYAKEPEVARKSS